MNKIKCYKNNKNGEKMAFEFAKEMFACGLSVSIKVYELEGLIEVDTFRAVRPKGPDPYFQTTGTLSAKKKSEL